MSPIKPKSTSSSNKPLFYAILFFVILLALGVVKMKSPQLTGTKDTATMIFSFNGGQEKSFSGPVMENMTILEALVASSQGNNIKLGYYVDNEGKVILATIGDDLNTKNHQWYFYLNHNSIKTEDINKIFVKTGDLIEAKFK